MQGRRCIKGHLDSSQTILIAHSGHGHFDLAAYDAYLSGKLVDYAYPEEEVRKAQAELPKVPAA